MENQTHPAPSLGQKTIRNVGITLFYHLSLRGIFFILNIAKVKLLSPAQMGILNLSETLTVFIGQNGGLGLNQAAVNLQEDEDRTNGTAFLLQLFFTLPLVLLIFFLAPLLAHFFEMPEAAPLIKIFAAIFLLGCLNFLPTTVLTRRLNFRTLGAIRLTSTTVTLGTFLFLFWMGMDGVTSVIGASIAGHAISILLGYSALRFRMRFPWSRPLAGRMIRLGVTFMALGLVATFLHSSGGWIIAKILGKDQLGYYAMANTWGNLIVVEFVFVLQQVLFPTFSRLQNDPPRFRQAYLECYRYAALGAFPIALGFMAVIPDFVHVICGEKWAPAIVPMQLWCLHGLTRSLGNLSMEALSALGRPQYALQVSVAQTLLSVPIALWATLHYGIAGTTMAYVGVGLAAMVASMAFFCHHLEIRFSQLVGLLWRSAFCAIAMATVVWISWGENYSWKTLLMRTATGIGIYLALNLLLQYRVIVQTVKMIGQAIKA